MSTRMSTPCDSPFGRTTQCFSLLQPNFLTLSPLDFWNGQHIPLIFLHLIPMMPELFSGLQAILSFP